jgi:uncharacterized protein (TIGR02145 family)
MKQRTVLYAAIMMIAILLLPGQANSQNLEVVGQAKITVMNTDNTADQVVVQQTDGMLAVRSASSLSGGSTGNYGTVVNPLTGKVWLDRNLGASQVAASSTDFASYGDLYQWGRNADGHQTIVWSTSNSSDGAEQSNETTSLASNYFTTGGNFITGSSNWLSNVETHMWSGTAAENNPCPSGFRVPTAAEWEQERLTWAPDNNAAGAFASPLKLPLAGYRNLSDGSLSFVGASGYYWSSTVSGSVARNLVFLSSNASMLTFGRAYGFAVRCLKD